MFPEMLPGELLCCLPVSIVLLFVALKVGPLFSRQSAITEYPIDEDMNKYIPYMNQD